MKSRTALAAASLALLISLTAKAGNYSLSVTNVSDCALTNLSLVYVDSDDCGTTTNYGFTGNIPAHSSQSLVSLITGCCACGTATHGYAKMGDDFYHAYTVSATDNITEMVPVVGNGCNPVTN